jgi:hypothetical protein
VSGDCVHPPPPEEDLLRGPVLEQAISRSRSCGACTACCTILGVKPLDKPAYQVCSHVRKGGGCGIYSDRPEPCKNYSCGWLEGFGETRDRPDRLGVILDSMAPAVDVQERAHGGDVEAIAAVKAAAKTMRAREVRPGAFKGERAARWLEKAHRAGRTVVLVPFGGRKLPVGKPLA